MYVCHAHRLKIFHQNDGENRWFIAGDYVFFLLKIRFSSICSTFNGTKFEYSFLHHYSQDMNFLWQRNGRTAGKKTFPSKEA